MALTAIYLIRHGEVRNPDKVLYGRLPRFGLTARGRAQAAAAGRWLADKAVAGLFTSPMLRARQTAGQIAAHLPGLEVRVSRRLNEVLSPFQGQPGALFDAREGDIYSEAGSGYEQPDDIVRRVRRFLDAVLRRYPGRATAAVTHGDIVTFTVLWAKGFDVSPQNKMRLPAAGFPAPYPAHASITTLVFDSGAPHRPPTVDYARPW